MYRRTIDLDNKHLSAICNYGTLLKNELDDLEGAILLYGLANKLDPSDATVLGNCHCARAKEAERRGEWAEAAHLYNTAVEAWQGGEMPLPADDPDIVECLGRSAELAAIAHEAERQRLEDEADDDRAAEAAGGGGEGAPAVRRSRVPGVSFSEVARVDAVLSKRSAGGASERAKTILGTVFSKVFSKKGRRGSGSAGAEGPSSPLDPAGQSPARGNPGGGEDGEGGDDDEARFADDTLATDSSPRGPSLVRSSSKVGSPDGPLSPASPLFGAVGAGSGRRPSMDQAGSPKPPPGSAGSASRGRPPSAASGSEAPASPEADLADMAEVRSGERADRGAAQWKVHETGHRRPEAGAGALVPARALAGVASARRRCPPPPRSHHRVALRCRPAALNRMRRCALGPANRPRASSPTTTLRAARCWTSTPSRARPSRRPGGW